MKQAPMETGGLNQPSDGFLWGWRLTQILFQKLLRGGTMVVLPRQMGHDGKVLVAGRCLVHNAVDTLFPVTHFLSFILQNHVKMAVMILPMLYFRMWPFALVSFSEGGFLY